MFSSRVEKSQNEFKPTLKKRKREKGKDSASNPVESLSQQPVQQQQQSQPQQQKPATSVTKQISQPVNQVKPQVAEQGSRMMDLIKQKFPTGKLSATEQSRREKKPLNLNQADSPQKQAPKFARQTPQLITVNGEIVVDKTSLQVEQQPLEHEEQEIIEEDALGRYITSASFRPKKKLTSPKWTTQMTDRFYLGLSYFGTNFKMISYMFPGLIQKHIKFKFKYEEKQNSEKVTMFLHQRKKAPLELREKMLKMVIKKKEDEQYFKSEKDMNLISNDNVETKLDGIQLNLNTEMVNDEAKLIESKQGIDAAVSAELDNNTDLAHQPVNKEPAIENEVVLPVLTTSQISGVKGNVARKRKKVV